MNEAKIYGIAFLMFVGFMIIVGKVLASAMANAMLLN